MYQAYICISDPLIFTLLECLILNEADLLRYALIFPVINQKSLIWNIIAKYIATINKYICSDDWNTEIVIDQTMAEILHLEQ